MTLGDLVGRGLVVENQPLAGMTTYKFGGTAAWYAEVATRRELELVAGVGGVPMVVLGRGSNLVVSDRGYDGLVVKLGGEFNEIGFDADTVEAGGAVSLPLLARACAAAGRGGLEWYVGIPGSVGGAVVMNAGGHGSDTAEWLIAASVLDVHTGRVTDETPEDLKLSYRHSRLGTNHVVFSARFRTVPRAREECEAMMREVTAWRRTHQPGGTFNAGSVFKNPPGDAAGRLIDSVGLKGFRVGGVSVSDRHANFFVAEDEACAQDVFDLVSAVQLRVHEATGVVLEPEVRFIGDFGGAT
ncbi:MAG: UDP-N-acetylmuramate dehydrogenase [bacterium]|nr:UDP-N-acetylmuramate dehydrogenase [bacterium]